MGRKSYKPEKLYENAANIFNSARNTALDLLSKHPNLAASNTDFTINLLKSRVIKPSAKTLNAIRDKDLLISELSSVVYNLENTAHIAAANHLYSAVIMDLYADEIPEELTTPEEVIYWFDHRNLEAKGV